MNKNLPKEPGLYWARTISSPHHEFYDMIVYVFGETPFLKIKGWVYGEETVCSVCVRAALYDIYEFGPKIERPDIIINE